MNCDGPRVEPLVTNHAPHGGVEAIHDDVGAMAAVALLAGDFQTVQTDKQFIDLPKIAASTTDRRQGSPMLGKLQH